tara:strand:- start:62 stop:1519 length:1458 start_codon:yes stop_codon:yes gene_type:complete
MHPFVDDHEDMVKFKEMDEWFNYINLPPLVEETFKEYYSKTLFGESPYFLQNDGAFFDTIPFALFNSLRNLETAEIMDQSGFTNWKIVQDEALGGYYGLVEPDEEGNIEHTEETEQWADEEGNYFLDSNNPNWDMELIPGEKIYEFVRKFNSDSMDQFENIMQQQGFITPYNKHLLKSVTYNLHELIQSHINGYIALHVFDSYVKTDKFPQMITLPPYLPKVYLENGTDNENTFSDEQINYFNQAIPNGIEPHNNNRRHYLAQDYLDSEFFHTENLEFMLQFKCEYLETENENQTSTYPKYVISSLLSSYYSETKEISLSQSKISALAAKFGYEFEDFCQAILCKNLGFWLTQDLYSYPTQWFLRIEMDFLHFYSDYFANMLCENENQKNILALLAVLGTSEHQAYYRTPTEHISNRTSQIIYYLPSFKKHLKLFEYDHHLPTDSSKKHEIFIFNLLNFSKPKEYKLWEVLDPTNNEGIGTFLNN